MTQKDIVIGVDGGQTTTLALCATLEGTVIGSALAGPSNHYHEAGGPERLEAAVTQGITGALMSAGVSADRVINVWLGMTGGVSEAREIAQKRLPHAEVNASFDTVTALAGAGAGEPGVVVIAGTGSVAYGKRADGRTARAGGWGYLMGDEGSGYDLGIQALRAVAQAEDGRGIPTQLSWRVPQQLRLPSLSEIHASLYSGSLSRQAIAALAQVVSDAAADGDLCAPRLLECAGTQLAETALAVLAALDSTVGGLPIFTTGGVFRAGEPLLRPFRERVAQAASASSVMAAQYSPSVGALLLALQAARVQFNEALLERIRSTLPAQAHVKFSNNPQ